MNEMPSLYVSNLPKENFFDLDFYKFFTSKGYKVKNAKVVIDSKTNRSRGYGYLQFFTKEEAERCLNQMNNATLNGLPLRIVNSISNPKDKYNVNANLLVKNIEKDASQQEVFNLFKTFGNILSAKLETYPNSKESRGFAYIQFEDVSHSDAAMEALNGKDFKGKPIEIFKLTKKDKKKLENTVDQKAAPKKNNLFVKGFPAGTNDENLKALFAEFGAIESA
jgi:polyadenylate-binding protein